MDKMAEIYAYEMTRKQLIIDELMAKLEREPRGGPCRGSWCGLGRGRVSTICFGVTLTVIGYFTAKFLAL